MAVLVTGGAGYIGSHVAWALVDAGYEVVILDDLSTGIRANVPPATRFVLGRVGDRAAVARLLKESQVTAVLHFAASIVVPESVTQPLAYYDNNVSTMVGLLRACDDAGVHQVVFSSSAAVYGAPDRVPIAESAALAPINPYGTTKLVNEWILRDAALSGGGLRYVALRYFNVAGADPAGRTGQSTPVATHLVKLAVQAALGRRPSLSVFGTDYPTDDGTCIRDYIHVSDLADVHVLALRWLEGGGDCQALNCGYGHGYSVRDVVDTVKRVSGVDFPVVIAPRRAGDPPSLVADASRLRSLLGWTPQHDDLDAIVRTALNWEARLGQG